MAGTIFFQTGKINSFIQIFCSNRIYEDADEARKKYRPGPNAQCDKNYLGKNIHYFQNLLGTCFHKIALKVGIRSKAKPILSKNDK